MTRLHRARQRRTSPFPPTSSRGVSPSRGHGPRALLEVLEHRMLLSTWEVNTLADPTAYVAGDDELSLREAIAEAVSGDTISFDASLSGGTIVLNGSQLAIASKDLTIQGLGAANLTISGNDVSRVLNLEASVVSMIGLTIAAGRATDGGGIFNDATGDLTLTDCAVSGNSATHYGGGIENWGTTILVNSSLSGNSAWAGAGLFTEPGSDVTMSNCAVTGNSADYGGGIESYYGTLALTDCRIAGNSASYGGAIFIDSGSMQGSGYNDVQALTRCEIQGNSATYGGGTYSYFGALTITGSTLSGNTADYGAGTYSYGDALSVDGSAFSGNVATGFGGGIYSESASSATIEDCAFSANTAGQGAGVFNMTSDAAISRCTFVQNRAGDAGGVADWFCSPTISACVFDGNSAGRGGGGIGDNGASPTISNCVFRNNTASEGGGMSSGWGSAAQLSNCTFDENSATKGGGMWNIQSSPVLDGCVFTSNASDTFGGGIYNEGGAPTLSNCRFAANSAVDGGGVAISGGATAITYCDVELNSATTTGGGIWDQGGAPAVTDCAIAGNSATSGGGIYGQGATLAITRSVVSGNRADFGGGGIANDGGSMSVEATTLDHNQASYGGGGLYGTGSTRLANCTIANNSASSGGGAYNDLGSRLAMTNSTISGNSANVGGGIRNNLSTVIADNTIIAGNASLDDLDIAGVALVVGDCHNNLIGAGGGLVNGINGNIVGVTNPMLGPLQENGGPTQTMALLPGSLAVDAGDNSLIPAGVIYDQRGAGYDRIVNGIVDIGAYESQNAVPSALVVLSSHTPRTDELLTASTTASDPDGDAISLTYLWKVNGEVVKTTTTTALADSLDLGSPGYGDRWDVVSVEVTPSDSRGAVGAASIDEAIVADTAPATQPAAVTTLEDTATVLVFDGTDIDGDTVGFVIASLPQHGRLYDGGGTSGTLITVAGYYLTGTQVTYVPDANWNSPIPDSFTFSADDGTLLSAPATASVSVAAVNDAPVASVALNSTSPFTKDTLIATVTCSDIEGEAIKLRYVWRVNGVAVRTVTTTLLTSSLNLANAGNGNAGDTISIEVTPTDAPGLSGLAATDTALVANSAPTVTPVSTSTVEDTYCVITLTASDLDGGSSRFIIRALPMYGTLYDGAGPSGTPITSDGFVLNGRRVTYLPNPNMNSAAFGEADQFDFAATDGLDSGPAAAVTVDVSAANDAPTLTGGSLGPVAVLEDSSMASLGLADLSFGPGGAPDEAGQTLRFRVTAVPPVTCGRVYLADGTTRVTAGRAYALDQIRGMRFVPAANFSGSTTLEFTVTDNGGTANGGQNVAAETLTIQILPVNDSPVRIAGTVATLTVREDAKATSLGLAGITYGPGGNDEASQTLRYIVSSVPDATFGSILLSDGVTVVTPGRECTLGQLRNLRFRPAADATGTAVFAYAVADNGGTDDGGSDTLTESMTIRVTPVNDAPVLISGISGPINVSRVAGLTPLFQSPLQFGPGGGADETGQTLTYKAMTLPAATLGTVYLANGVTAVVANRSYTLAQIQGMLFRPTGRAGSTRFEFSVTDSGGIANGGANTFLQSVRITLSA